MDAYKPPFHMPDRIINSAAFVELMLEIFLDTLKETTVVGKKEDSNTPSNAPMRQDGGTLENENGGLDEKIILNYSPPCGEDG